MLIKLPFAVSVIKSQGWATSALGRRGAGIGLVPWDGAGTHFSSARNMSANVPTVKFWRQLVRNFNQPLNNQ